MVFVGVALLLSFTSKFTPTPINFLEGYGIVMLGVVIRQDMISTNQNEISFLQKTD